MRKILIILEERERETEIQRNRETERDREKERKRERERERERDEVKEKKIDDKIEMIHKKVLFLSLKSNLAFLSVPRGFGEIEIYIDS